METPIYRFHSLGNFVFFALSILALTLSVSAQREPNGVCMDSRGCTPDGPRIIPTDPEKVRIDQLNARFLQLLRRARELGMADMSNFEISPPTTIAELDLRVQRLYGDTFYLLDQLRYDLSGRKVMDLQEEINALRKENEGREKDIREIPARIDKATRFINEEGSRAKSLEKTLAIAENAASNSHTRAAKARKNTIDILTAVMTPQQRADFEGRLSTAIGPDEIKPYWESSAPTPRAGQPGVVRPAPRYAPKTLPKLGSIEETLQQIERNENGVFDGRRQRDENNRRIGQYSGERESLLNRQHSLRLQYTILSTGADDLETQARSIKKRIDNFYLDKVVSRDNVYAMATAEIVWNYVKDKIVIPRVQRFLKLNGLMPKYARDVLTAANELRNNPKKIITLSGRFKDMEDFLEAEEEVLNVVPMFEKYATDAADALGTNTWPDANRIKDSLFRDLGDTGVKIANKATGNESDTEIKVRRFLFGDE